MLWNMAAGADCSPPFILDSSYVKDSVPTVVKDEELDIAEEFRQVSIGKPPRHLSVARHSISSATVAQPNCPEFDISVSQHTSPSTDGRSSFLPVWRSGCCAERGPKQYMEDEHVCIDNVFEQYGETVGFPSPGAFYGVFDGHGGTDAAVFIRKNIFKFIVEDSSFPVCMEKAIKNAFLKADHAFAADSTLDISSGTTALTALLFGRTLVVANAGDCRAVLGKRGRAFDLSRDHKPNCASERARIERLGGAVYDGYLNGQLSVARAIGDWHMKGPKGSSCPLSAEPELQETVLTEDDEFLIIGCDGLWDVMSSQGAVSIARKELMIHNDPERCSRELVREALKRNTCDNLTVIVVCFSHDPPPMLEVTPTRVRRSISAEGLNLLKGVLEMESNC